MNFENKFKYFVYNIFPVLIIGLSFFGDIFGLIIFIKSKKLNKIGPIHIYKYLFVFSLINTYFMIVLYLYGFGIYLETLSKLSCQLNIYISFVTPSIQPMILVYISAERFISIRYPSKKLILNKNFYQHVYIILLTVFNLFINSWIPFNHDLIDKRNSTNKFILNFNPNDNLECSRENNSELYFAILNTKIIPYLLMIVFTILLIFTVFKSRRKVNKNYSIRQNETFKKDVKFAFSSISLNIIFFLFNLPAAMIWISNIYPNLFLMFIYLYMFSFSIQFYLLLIFNSLFRNEFLSFFRKSPKNNSSDVVSVRTFDFNLILDFNVNETYV